MQPVSHHLRRALSRTRSGSPDRKEAIFGSFDGMTSTLGVVAGLLAAHATPAKILAAAVGIAVAATTGMGAGQYLSDGKRNMRKAVVMAVATLIGSVLPALLFIFGASLACVLSSVAITIVAAGVIGYYRGYAVTYLILSREVFGHFAGHLASFGPANAGRDTCASRSPKPQRQVRLLGPPVHGCGRPGCPQKPREPRRGCGPAWAVVRERRQRPGHGRGGRLTQGSSPPQRNARAHPRRRWRPRRCAGAGLGGASALAQPSLGPSGDSMNRGSRPRRWGGPVSDRWMPGDGVGARCRRPAAARGRGPALVIDPWRRVRSVVGSPASTHAACAGGSRSSVRRAHRERRCPS
jgi:hypothetical protein